MSRRRKKNVKKAILMTIGILASLVCICCIIYIYQYVSGMKVNTAMAANTYTQIIAEAPSDIYISRADPQSQKTGGEASREPNNTRVVDTVISRQLVDFGELQKQNPDIYAWINVPGTVVDYPVLQRENDDGFYMNHGSDGRYYTCGSIFSESKYNDTSFDEPMTILYGHNLRTLPTMFTQLNNFIDADFFDANRYFYIYLPDKVYKYEIFAAFPNDRYHLMAKYDFDDPAVFEEYFETLSTTDMLNMNFRDELMPVEGDRVVTLSTCYTPSSAYRFLVMGVLTEIMHVVEEPEAENVG